MGSPHNRNNFNQSLQSPYAMHLSQYPSQSEGFDPLDFGGSSGSTGRISSSTPAKYDQNISRHNSSGYFNQNRPNRGRNNRYFNTGTSSHRNNHHLQSRQSGGYSNFNRPQQQSGGGGGRGCGGGGGGGHQRHKQYNNDDISIDQYFHPTMLEDPWKELMERQNAIKNSQIEIQPDKSEQATTTLKHEDSVQSNEQGLKSKES